MLVAFVLLSTTPLSACEVQKGALSSPMLDNAVLDGNEGLRGPEVVVGLEEFARELVVDVHVVCLSVWWVGLQSVFPSRYFVDGKVFGRSNKPRPGI